MLGYMTQQPKLTPRSRAELATMLQADGVRPELADLASFLVSDRAGYINGEMVVIDGGAHLRSSGAEDLLGWTEAQWAAQRDARSRG